MTEKNSGGAQVPREKAEMQLPWKAVETPTGWELQHERGGWLFELNDRPDRATETDQVFIESQDKIMRFIVLAGNCHHELLEAARCFEAWMDKCGSSLDSGQRAAIENAFGGKLRAAIALASRGETERD